MFAGPASPRVIVTSIAKAPSVRLDTDVRMGLFD
jgi:hypothetical protein